MVDHNAQAEMKISKKYKALRAVTIAFAILGPVAMIISAVVLTLCEDWWFYLFVAYLAGIAMIVSTLYLSLLTLLCELTRHVRNRTKSNIYDTPFTKYTHRILTGTAIAGIVTFSLFLMILYDVLNGGSAILHFLCGGIIVVLYLLLGIHAMMCRAKKNKNK